MVGATDLEKARMQIKRLKRDIRQICSKTWFTSPRLKEAQDNVPNYFIEEHGLTEKAITEAYFLGRQDGRLTMAQAIMKRLNSEEEEMNIVEQLRKSANIVYAQDGYTFRLGLQNEAADEIERLQDEVDQLRAISRKLYVEKAHLLADKISNEIMRNEFDALCEEMIKLRKENAGLKQKMNKKEKKKTNG